MNVVTQFNRLSTTAQAAILTDINRKQIAMGNQPITKISELGAAAATCLDNTRMFTEQLQRVHRAVSEKVAKRKNVDSREYMDKYLHFYLFGGTHPAIYAVSMATAKKIEQKVQELVANA